MRYQRFLNIVAVCVLTLHALSEFSCAQVVTADEAFGEVPEFTPALVQQETPSTSAPESETAISEQEVLTIEPLRPTRLSSALFDDARSDSFLIRLSWDMEDTSYIQTGYQVLIASVGNFIDDNYGDIWDSGHVRSDARTITITEHETFARALTSGWYYWKVRVWDEWGVMSEYAPAERFYFVRKEGLGVRDGVPAAPHATRGIAVSPNEIRWEFEDRADTETGFALFEGYGGVTVTTAPTPVSDYYYLIEKGLTPNTQYRGRTVRSFNDRGFSDASDTYIPVYSLAATPGVLTVFTMDGLVRISIDPHGNPIHTEYAIFDAVTESYLDRNGVRSQQPAWHTLEVWQAMRAPSDRGPYRLAVRARNGDGVMTGFSPAVGVLAQRLDDVTLTVDARVYSGGIVLGATTGRFMSGLIAVIMRAGPGIAVALLVAGLLALGYLVARRDMVRGAIATALHLVHHDTDVAFSTHMDSRFLAPRTFAFWHSFTRASLATACAIFIVTVAAHMTTGTTEAQHIPQAVATREVRPGDVIEYTVTFRNNGSHINDPRLHVMLPSQLQVLDRTIMTAKQKSEVYATLADIQVNYRELHPAETGVVTYKTIVRSAPEYGGTDIVQRVVLRAGAREVTATAPAFSLQQTLSSLAHTIVRTTGTPDLYFITDRAERRYIPTMELFYLFGGDEAQIVTIDSQTLELFIDAGRLRYPAGSYIRFTPEGYVYEVRDEAGSMVPIAADSAPDDTIIYTIPPEQFVDYIQ